MCLFPLIAKSVEEQIVSTINDFINNNRTTLVTTLVLVLTSAVIIAAFILLLGRKEDKRSLYAAFVLIIIASVLATTLSPLKEWNTLVVAALLTPVFAYFIGLLKEKQKLSSEKDSLVWEYKCQQLQKESDVISELLGELSIHAAVFKSPYPLNIETRRWENSFKASVISELHTLSIARYYNYILLYNNFIPKYNRFIEQKENKDLKGISENFQALQEAFFDAEVLVYFTLTYDLGFLQQNYLVRPTDEFPVHLSLMFRNYLEKCGIIRKHEKAQSTTKFSKIKAKINKQLEKWRIIKPPKKIDVKKIFSENSSARFNKKTVMELNNCYHRINYQLKTLNSVLDKKKMSA